MYRKTVSAGEAQTNFDHLLGEVIENGDPILITSQRSNAVLVSEEAWRGIEETLYLVSIPGMRESILKGGAINVGEQGESPDKLDW